MWISCSHFDMKTRALHGLHTELTVARGSQMRKTTGERVREEKPSCHNQANACSWRKEEALVCAWARNCRKPVSLFPAMSTPTTNILYWESLALCWLKRRDCNNVHCCKAKWMNCELRGNKLFIGPGTIAEAACHSLISTKQMEFIRKNFLHRKRQAQEFPSWLSG